MEVIVTIRLSTNSRALHKETDVELISHADTAVHLDTFLSGIAHDLGAFGLRHTRQDRALFTVGIECLKCGQDGRLTDFYFSEQLCGTVL